MVNRNYKDRLFRAVFGSADRKEYALSLYNAINLYEQPSTYNPNMPLRGLLYFARQYEKYLTNHELDLFRTRQLKLPTPRYVVFFNGRKELPERSELRLSSAFEGKDPAIEVIAQVINTNHPYNKQLMERCRPLYDYARFVDHVKQYTAMKMNLEEAIDRAVEAAVQENLLDGYFKAHRTEVKQMVLSEYNEELTLQNRFEDGKEEGFKIGMQQGIERGKLALLKQLVVEEIISVEQAAEKAGMGVEDFEKLLKEPAVD